METFLSDQIRGLLNRYTQPCAEDCEHSQCPLLRELHGMVVSYTLERARLKVKPIVDAEQEGESVGDLMNMRINAAASSPAPAEPPHCEMCQCRHPKRAHLEDSVNALRCVECPCISFQPAQYPKTTVGPLPTTAGGEQVISHDYGDRIVYETRKVSVEILDPPTSEAAKAHGLRRIARRHYHPEARNAVAPAEPLPPTGEQQQWTSDGCGLFRNGAWVTSTAVPEVAAFLARRLNNSATSPTTPSDAAMRAAEELKRFSHTYEDGIWCMDERPDGKWVRYSDIAAIITRHLPQPPSRDFQKRLFDECVTANWDPEHKNTFAEEIAHLHEELSEAFRAWRRYKDCEIRVANGKLEGVPIEFADALIGMFYNAELHGFDLLAAIETKHQFNLTRNYVQEGRQLHAAATTSPETPEPIGHAKNPDAFCLICNEHPCRLIAPVAATADNEGECQYCGKTGGKVISFNCGSMTTARWVCPYCLDDDNSP